MHKPLDEIIEIDEHLSVHWFIETNELKFYWIGAPTFDNNSERWNLDIWCSRGLAEMMSSECHVRKWGIMGFPMLGTPYSLMLEKEITDPELVRKELEEFGRRAEQRWQERKESMIRAHIKKYREDKAREKQYRRKQS